jgi:hypothetical protein
MKGRPKTRFQKRERQIGSCPKFYKPIGETQMAMYKQGRISFEEAYREYIKLEIIPGQSILRDLKRAYIYPDTIHRWARKFVTLDKITGEIVTYDYLSKEKLDIIVNQSYEVVLMIANTWTDEAHGADIELPM